MTEKSRKRDRPLILVSNDDGVEAPGIAALAEAMARIGEVFVCAPSSEQSAKGHSISVDHDLETRSVERDGKVWAVAVGGTPADCVKLAVTRLLEGRRPDLVASGVNRGRNTGMNINYSGTVAAAAEGAILGIPAMAVSLAARREEPEIDFGPSGVFAERLARRILREGLPDGVALNMNVPHAPLDEIESVVVTRMGRSVYLDSFTEQPLENGAVIYRNVGDKMHFDREFDDGDDMALENNRVSLTPLRFDRTFYQFREDLETWAPELSSDPS